MNGIRVFLAQAMRAHCTDLPLPLAHPSPICNHGCVVGTYMVRKVFLSGLLVLVSQGENRVGR